MLQTKLARYALACVAVLGALLIVLAFSPELEAHRYAPFIFAIVLVAFLGDLPSALTATALAIAPSNYFDWTRLARANAELRNIDAAKDRFIAAVSHELRTPITVIQGWAQILAQHDGEQMREARRRGD